MPGMFSKLDSIAMSMAEADPAPGISVAVVMAGDTLLMKGYGFADLENEVPATKQTVYRIGSITKQFTSAAIMRLVDDGTISLDDPLSTFLPGYPSPGGEVTIHQLLNHTSGIPSYTDIDYLQNSILDLSHEEVVALFEDKALIFQPGEQWAYNNSGYFLLGMVIEKATGKSYEEYLADTFFSPLNLNSIVYCGNTQLIKHRASGYGMQEGEVVNAKYVNMSYPFAAGALCATVGDLIAWTDHLNGTGIVSPGSYEHMITPTVLGDGSTQAYGYGLFIGDLDGVTSIFHGGGINGFVSYLSYYPDHDLTIAVLTNSIAAIPINIEKKLARAVLGLPEPTYEEIEMTSEAMEEYIGVYEIAASFQLTLSIESGKVILTPTGQEAAQIFPYEKDKFFSKIVEAQFTFNRDEEGRIESITLHQNGHQMTGAKIE